MRLGIGLNLGDRLRFASAAAPVSTLVDGLVAYWNLDEESGTRADAVGDADLTDNNTVGYDTGKNGNAASFVVANSESLSTADAPVLQPGTDDFTVSLWVKPSTTNAQLYAGKGVQEDWTVDGYSGAYRFYVKNGGSYPTASAGTVSVGEWAHLIGWRSSTDSKVYLQVNGGTPGEAATGEIVDSGTAGDLKLGYVAGTGYDVVIDEVALWSRVLTSDERAELYNSGDGKFFNGTNFV